MLQLLAEIILQSGVHWLLPPVLTPSLHPVCGCRSWRWACGPCPTRPQQQACRWRLSTWRSEWREAAARLSRAGRQLVQHGRTDIACMS